MRIMRYLYEKMYVVLKIDYCIHPYTPVYNCIKVNMFYYIIAAYILIQFWNFTHCNGYYFSKMPYIIIEHNHSFPIVKPMSNSIMVEYYDTCDVV